MKLETTRKVGMGGKRTRRTPGFACAALALAVSACAQVPSPPGSEAGPQAPEAVVRSAPSPPSVDPGPCPATRGQLVLDLVNDHRARAGLEPLDPDALLVDAAVAHARDLADHTGSMGHLGSDGSEPPERITRAGYDWVRVGENVAGGTPTPSTAVAGWMRSADHRHNILTAAFEHAGVAYVDVPGSEWGTYWVMVYAVGDRAGRRSPLRCHP